MADVWWASVMQLEDNAEICPQGPMPLALIVNEMIPVQR